MLAATSSSSLQHDDDGELQSSPLSCTDENNLILLLLREIEHDRHDTLTVSIIRMSEVESCIIVFGLMVGCGCDGL
eukprot:scaffold5192_cov94-Cyclotella_meneghiniana.AAC.2